MRFGPFELSFHSEVLTGGFVNKITKSYSDLVAMLNREKWSGPVNLRTNTSEQLSEYKSWVYSCVSLISDRVSTVPFSFYNKITGEEVTISNRGYSVFTKPILNPNPLMSMRFIKAFCQLQLDMCGMGIIYKARNKLGKVWELWPLNMNDFVGVVNSSNDPMCPNVLYEFRFDNTSVFFTPEELVVLYYPHPTDMWKPMSPIQAQAYSVDIDTYVEVYERDFFKNSARVDMVLQTESQLDDSKADSIKTRWKAKHGHGRNFHDIAVLDSGLKPIPLNYTNKDFEFLQLANWSKDKILGAYRVPEDKLGKSGATNRAGGVQVDIAFNRESIQPRLTLWDEELTGSVLFGYDPRIEMRHQNPIPRDRLLDMQESKSYCGVPTLTLNEFRHRTHKLPPVENGDDIILPKTHIFLKDLQKAVDAEISARTSTERDREGETHLNPDGSDDRDDNPTEGRMLEAPEKKQIEYVDVIGKSMPVWNALLLQNLLDKKFENQEAGTGIVKQVFSELLIGTIDALFMHFGKTPVIVDAKDWIIPIVNKASSEYIKTLFSNLKNDKMTPENEYIQGQFDSNPRLSKITNALLRSTVNYVNWIILENEGTNKCWVIKSNECGHRGRLKENVIKSGELFKMGETSLRFPGETLVFSCDCTIEGEN